MPTFLPGSPEIQAAAKAAGIDKPYYGVEVEGDSFRFYLYGGTTVAVRALPSLGTAEPARAAPQRPKPAVLITGSLEATPVVESGTLETMKKAELVALAAKLGINLRSKATKAEIIKQIQEVKP